MMQQGLATVENMMPVLRIGGPKSHVPFVQDENGDPESFHAVGFTGEYGQFNGLYLFNGLDESGYATYLRADGGVGVSFSIGGDRWWMKFIDGPNVERLRRFKGGSQLLGTGWCDFYGDGKPGETK